MFVPKWQGVKNVSNYVINTWRQPWRTFVLKTGDGLPPTPLFSNRHTFSALWDLLELIAWSSPNPKCSCLCGGLRLCPGPFHMLFISFGYMAIRSGQLIWKNNRTVFCFWKEWVLICYVFLRRLWINYLLSSVIDLKIEQFWERETSVSGVMTSYKRWKVKCFEVSGNLLQSHLVKNLLP